MVSGDPESISEKQRTMIQKSQEAGGFEDNRGGNPARGDLAEYANGAHFFIMHRRGAAKQRVLS